MSRSVVCASDPSLPLSSPHAAANAPTKALEINGLYKVYSGGLKALQGINMEVLDGGFRALLGPNGAGKSTTIGIMTSLVRKSAGRVRIYGIDIDHEHSRAKSLIGVAPQEINFSQFETSWEIVGNQAGFYGLPRDRARRNAERCLRAVGLWERRRVRSRKLSGGMKRRLLIARAMVHEPRMLILDEPTAGVDVELRRSLWELLRRVNAQGITILLTTHNLEEAENLCSHATIIDQGRIIEDTSMKQLLARRQMEIFILDLQHPLEHPPRLPDFQSELLDPHTLRVSVKRSRGVNPLFEVLSERGIRVSSMRNQANRLEELFLSLLGGNHQHADVPQHAGAPPTPAA